MAKVAQVIRGVRFAASVISEDGRQMYLDPEDETGARMLAALLAFNGITRIDYWSELVGKLYVQITP